jgi:RHS repeat-associated protein
VTSTYDADGNVISRSWGSGLTQTLTWDAFGRLIKVSQRDSANNGYDWTAIYDGLGRRLLTAQQPVANNVAGGATNVTTSIYDPQVEFLEIGVAVSGTKAWKVYGPDLNGRFGGLQGTGGLEAVILDADGTTTGVINDQFGNGVATVTGTGAGASVTWNTTRVGAYGPLPGIQAQTLTDVSQLAASTAWRSRRIDPTGFYWLGARYYEPTSGRFLSADPMGQAASPSLYDYAGGDPVNRMDPDGRCDIDLTSKTFKWNGHDIPYNQGDGQWITPNDLAANQANQINALNSDPSVWSQAGSAALQGGADYLKGLGNGLEGAASGTLWALAHPWDAVQGLADQLGTTAGMLVYDRAGLASDLSNTLTNPYQLGNAVGNVVGGTAIGAGTSVVAGAAIGQLADVGNTAGTVSNPVPDTLARVIPGEGPFKTLGLPKDTDVFVTDPAAIKGMTPAQISQRLGIPPSDTYTVIQYPTPSTGVGSPIFRTNPGFVGGGLTSGGAPEFVVPNGPIPPSATTTVIGGP